MTTPDGVARVTLDRPERRNALSADWRDELADRFEALADDPTVKVLVIDAVGPVFCAGFDLREFERGLADDAFGRRIWTTSDRFHHALLAFPVPVIAAVQGPAVAGGFDLALMCDLRIASTEASFSRPEVAWATPVYGILADLVGGALARELSFTSRTIGATEALALRLVNAVVEPGALAAGVDELAASVAARHRADLLATKAKVIQRAGLAMKRTLEL